MFIASDKPSEFGDRLDGCANHSKFQWDQAVECIFEVDNTFHVPTDEDVNNFRFTTLVQ